MGSGSGTRSDAQGPTGLRSDGPDCPTSSGHFVLAKAAQQVIHSSLVTVGA